MQWILLGIITSYLVGSIPTAYIFGRVLKGIDIRQYGSGNVGATNALRVLGKRAGVLVLVLDILKGVIPVILFSDLVLFRYSGIYRELGMISAGISCICGHNWTIFLNFKGGKGIATTFGVLIALALRIPGFSLVIFCVIFIWFLVFMVFRFVSAASLVAAIALPVSMIILKQHLILIAGGVFLAVFVVIRHKSNISRLLKGKEPKLIFGSKGKKTLKQ